MAVGTHLGIPLNEYDARIRTFIPWYDEMLDAAASSTRLTGIRAPHIVDLGIGSGALAERCVKAFPRATVTGIDSDAAMLAMASSRLGRRLTTIADDFESAMVPVCDAIVSAFALHHVPTPQRKSVLYRKCHRALRPGRSMVIADCQLSADPVLAAADRTAWLWHLSHEYSPPQSRAYLRAWAHEDFYFTLNDELALLERAGFVTDVVWRKHGFAVIVATRD
jgi:trans-aconitate methyltransferase